MFSFKIIFFILFALNVWTIDAEISDKRLCIDEKCSQQIGEGKTLITYPPNSDKRILSFSPNTPVKIFSYGAGSKPNYIGVEIDGTRGYVSKELIRETRVFKKPTLLMPTEEAYSSSPEKTIPEIQAASVQEQYEIIDGTKIPVGSGFASTTSGSAEPIASTESPLVTQGPISSEKTEDLILDLNKKHNIITSETKSQEEEINKKQPESLQETLEEQKVEKLDQVKNLKQNLVIEELDNKKEDQNSELNEMVMEKNDKITENINLAENAEENNVNKDNKQIISENPDKAQFEGDQEDDDNEDDEADEDDDSEEDEFEEIEEQGDGFLKKVMDTIETFRREDKIEDKVMVDKSSGEEVKTSLNSSTTVEDNQETIKAQDKVIVDENSGAEVKTSLNSSTTVEDNQETTKAQDQTPETKPTEEKIEIATQNISHTITVVNNKKSESPADIETKTPALVDNGVLPIDSFGTPDSPKYVDVENKVEIIEGSVVENQETLKTVEALEPYENNTQDLSPPLGLDLNNQQISENKNNENFEQVDKKIESSADIETTTPFSVDDEVLPIDTFVTPDPLKYLDIENKVEMVEALVVENQETLKTESTPEPREINTQGSSHIGELDLNNLQFGENKNNENLEQIHKRNESYEETKIKNFDEEIINESNNVIKEAIESKENQFNISENAGLSEPFKEKLSSEETSFPRPDLGPNKPTFIDEEPKNSEQDSNNIFEDEKPTLPKKDSGGLLFGLSSLFSGGVSGSEEVQQAAGTASPSYDEAVNESNAPEEITEEPFIKTEAYVTGDTNANVNNDDFNVKNSFKTEDNVIKTIDTQNLAADRSSYSYLSEVPDFSQEKDKNVWTSTHDQCDTEQCFNDINKENTSNTTTSLTLDLILQSFSSELFLYLSTTAVSMIIFLFLYIVVDKCKREAPLISRINKLEQELLVTKKENQMLQEQDSTLVVQQSEPVIQGVPNEIVEELTEQLKEAHATQQSLEEQIAALEKELDNSTEVGIELNKMISDMLNSSDENDILKENVEQMKNRLEEQQVTINSITESLKLKDTENYELRLELEISNKKVMDLQEEVGKMVHKIIKIDEEKDAQQSFLEKEIEVYQLKIKEATSKEEVLSNELQALRTQLVECQRTTELKIKELNALKESLDQIQSMKNNKDAINSLLNVAEVKAELEQFKSENTRYSEQLRVERESNGMYVTKIQTLMQDLEELRTSFENADKEKVEVKTKLEVLNNYFKEKEEQMQKEISKYESLWAIKKGEATSTTERIRLLQEDLQNYKAQNESLKQEVMNQEVELKSQISVLEKKAHESWMTNRQTERKLEEAKHEAAQLRNRLTMKERAALEGQRMQSPLRQNGELTLSPAPLDATFSPPPPLIGNPRDLTMSPSIPGMPPLPFLPPPPGGLPPFMPPLPGRLPPPGMPPFMPPPMFPGDHRPPPLGRMSSPPPRNRSYSPESTIYSEYDRYDRRSPSPIYDSEYGASPPNRAYSPYEERLRDERLRDDRRDFRRDEPRRDYEYNRTLGRSNGRTSKGLSSGSEVELGKINRKSNKKV